MAAVVEQTTPAVLRPAVAGRNPWALAWRRLRGNRIALAALVLFLLIVVLSLAAPLYAHDAAHVGNPLVPNLNGTTIVGGHTVPVMQQGGGVLKLGETPIGPTWNVHHYFLGADLLGRDVASLLLYGGRASLQIGVCSAVLCSLIATIVALIAGFFGGIVDAILSRLMDVIWAFPVYLLAISLATELLTHSNGVQGRSADHQRDQPVDADGHHRAHLRAVCVPSGPRPGAVGRQQGVRRGGYRAGRV